MGHAKRKENKTKKYFVISSPGLITLTADGFEKNIDVYAVSHSSAFVPAGSVRVAASVDNGDLIAAAYLSPDEATFSIVMHALYYDDSRTVAVEVEGRTFAMENVGREASVSVVVQRG